MAIKLGEMLVKGGAITLAQLEEALKYQVIFGGKLGTNLIELGYLGEEGIAWFLSEKLGLPYIHPDKLMNIPQELIQLIPKKIACKYNVIPLSLNKKKLTLAMAAPSDLAAIDEISFTTGLTIKPVVAPEVRVMLALEKYYNAERDVRYIPIIEKQKKEEEEKRLTSLKNQKPAQTVTPPPYPEPSDDLPLPVKDFLDAKQETPIEEIEELEEAEIIEEETRRELIESFSIDEISSSLAEARDREEIADIIVRYVGLDFNNVALFIVKNDSVHTWRALNNNHIIEEASNIRIPFSEESALKTVAKGKSFYLGPLAETEGNKLLLNLFGGERPSTVLLVPIVVMGKIVNILYVDDSEVNLGEKVVDLQRFAVKASMAFEILIIKKKIVMT